MLMTYSRIELSLACHASLRFAISEIRQCVQTWILHYNPRSIWNKWLDVFSCLISFSNHQWSAASFCSCARICLIILPFLPRLRNLNRIRKHVNGMRWYEFSLNKMINRTHFLIMLLRHFVKQAVGVLAHYVVHYSIDRHTAYVKKRMQEATTMRRKCCWFFFSKKKF